MSLLIAYIVLDFFAWVWVFWRLADVADDSRLREHNAAWDASVQLRRLRRAQKVNL